MRLLDFRVGDYMKNDLQNRTKKLAIAIIRFCSVLPQKQEFWVISKQLIRCATSVGANYRSACRGKSKPDFINKLSIVEEEADESLYWMEIIKELSNGEDGFSKYEFRMSNQMSLELERLYKEMDEITAIIVASKKTAKRNME